MAARAAVFRLLPFVVALCYHIFISLSIYAGIILKHIFETVLQFTPMPAFTRIYGQMKWCELRQAAWRVYGQRSECAVLSEG